MPSQGSRFSEAPVCRIGLAGTAMPSAGHPERARDARQHRAPTPQPWTTAPVDHAPCHRPPLRLTGTLFPFDTPTDEDFLLLRATIEPATRDVPGTITR